MTRHRLGVFNNRNVFSHGLETGENKVSGERIRWQQGWWQGETSVYCRWPSSPVPSCGLPWGIHAERESSSFNKATSPIGLGATPYNLI